MIFDQNSGQSPDFRHEIRPIMSGDFVEWKVLWDSNNQGIDNAELTRTTWQRLNDPDFPIYGLVAVADGKLAGLLHYVEHATTGNIKPVCYVQDVFVDPDFRRRGLAKSLILELAKIGQKNQKWARLYWLAESKNLEARKLYENLAVKLDFHLYVYPL